MLTAILQMFNWKKQPVEKKLKLEYQYQILERIKQLYEHGYNLNDALDVLKWEKQIKQTIEKLETLLYEGDNFIQSLEKLNFNTDIINYLKIAYQNGSLQEGLKHCCLMLKQRQQLLEKLKKITRYPIFLFCFFFVILYFMKTSIFPSFTQIFASPAANNSTFSNAESIINFIFYGTIFLVISILISVVISLTFGNVLSIDKKIRFIEHIPIYKQYKRLHSTYLFVTHLGSLLSSGLTMKDCLYVIKSQPYQGIVHYYAALISDHLAQGYNYSTILPQCTLLEHHLTRMMTKDRNQEQVLKELTMYAEHLLSSMEAYIKRWIGLLQPIILSILSIFVVFVYLTLMLPMFDYIDSM